MYQVKYEYGGIHVHVLQDLSIRLVLVHVLSKVLIWRYACTCTSRFKYKTSTCTCTLIWRYACTCTSRFKCKTSTCTCTK